VGPWDGSCYQDILHFLDEVMDIGYNAVWITQKTSSQKI
jgi:hypothetical protein